VLALTEGRPSNESSLPGIAPVRLDFRTIAGAMIGDLESKKFVDRF
jgi:hypothetical protein